MFDQMFAGDDQSRLNQFTSEGVFFEIVMKKNTFLECFSCVYFKMSSAPTKPIIEQGRIDIMEIAVWLDIYLLYFKAMSIMVFTLLRSD